jgi:IS5 family transposase
MPSGSLRKENRSTPHESASAGDGRYRSLCGTVLYRTQSEVDELTLAVEEFLRRFLLHLLPRGFVRIRHFGFLANRQRATLLPLCLQLLRG